MAYRFPIGHWSILMGHLGKVTPSKTSRSSSRSMINSRILLAVLDQDRLRITLAALDMHPVTHRLQRGNKSFQRTLDLEIIRHPLMMNTRLIDGRLDIHFEVDHIDDHLKDRVDNGAATWTAGHTEWLAVLENDRRRHRTEHTLSWLD